MADNEGKIRIDKWIWFARIVKSRSKAKSLIEGGKLRVNSNKIASASHAVRTGDVLTITLERSVKVLKVAELGSRRGPAPEAQALYEDLTPPPEKAAAEKGSISSVVPVKTKGQPGRPTKKARRTMDALREQFNRT
ncbi:MAG: RNA-binding S4 domain-containing protein [Pseudomonadota bacterium]